MSTVFKKIIDKEIPTKLVYEDEKCICIHDLRPKAPVHLLLIPKKEIPTLQDLTAQDAALMGHLMITIPIIAKQMGMAEKGYRIIINCKEYGRQEVYHLHIHILGGKVLGE